MATFYHRYMQIGRSLIKPIRFRDGWAFASLSEFYDGFPTEDAAHEARTRLIARSALERVGIGLERAKALVDETPLPDSPANWLAFCRAIDAKLSDRDLGPRPPRSVRYLSKDRSPKAVAAIEQALRDVTPIYFLPAMGKRPYPSYGFKVRKGMRAYPIQITDRNRAALAKQRTERVVRLALEDHLGWPWQASLDAVKTVRELYPPKPGVRDRSDSLFWRVIETYGERPPASYAASAPEPEESPTAPQLDPELEALLS